MAAVPGNQRKGLALNDPFFEPNELVLLLGGLVLPGEKYAAILAAKPLLTISDAPADDLETTACPTGFFLT